MSEHLISIAGTVVANNPNSKTASPRGPVLLKEYQLSEKLVHQNRERIPERFVYAKGMGEPGTVAVIGDLTRASRAKVLEPGKKTGLLISFPTVTGDAARNQCRTGGHDSTQLRVVSRIFPLERKLRLVSNFAAGIQGTPGASAQHQLALVPQVDPEDAKGGGRAAANALWSEPVTW
ncbi:MAG TPA: catalase [Acidobacteriaceae bacterium]